MSAKPKRQPPRVTDDTVFIDTDLDIEPITLPSGRILDEAGAEKFAQEVLERVRARRNGKSTSHEAEHDPSPILHFRVPEPMHEEVVERAAEEGISVSRLARKALEQYLAS